MVMCARCEPHKLPGSVRHPFAQELPVAKLALGQETSEQAAFDARHRRCPAAL